MLGLALGKEGRSQPAREGQLEQTEKEPGWPDANPCSPHPRQSSLAASAKETAPVLTV